MKNGILIISIFSACLIVPSVFVVASNNAVGEKAAIQTYFHMDILDDGKLTDQKILVDLRIFSDGSKVYADWNHVYIDPEHKTKRVILKAQHFSTLEGSIKNVIMNNETFSLTLDLSLTPLGAGRTVQVVGNKKAGVSRYDVEAAALWWSDILNKKIKTEWQSTDKKVILPYKEVF